MQTSTDPVLRFQQKVKGGGSLEGRSQVRDQRLVGWAEVWLSSPLLPAPPVPMAETSTHRLWAWVPDTTRAQPPDALAWLPSSPGRAQVAWEESFQLQELHVLGGGLKSGPTS